MDIKVETDSEAEEVPEPQPNKLNKRKHKWHGDIDLSGKAKCLVLVGACGKGKSNSMRYILLKNMVDRKYFKFGLVFTKTKFSNEYNFLPDKYIIDGYSEEVLSKYLDKLRKYKKKHKKVPPNFVIFEDLIGLIRKQDPFLISFMGSHRHTNTMCGFLFQHLNTGASTLLREITTHAICFNSKQMNTMDSIWMNY